jgi:hypothetical protein
MDLSHSPGLKKPACFLEAWTELELMAYADLQLTPLGQPHEVGRFLNVR